MKTLDQTILDQTIIDNSQKSVDQNLQGDTELTNLTGGEEKTEETIGEEMENKQDHDQKSERADAQKNIEEIFAKDFGITAENLKDIEGFNNLSDGQQKLVIENLRQLKLAKIEIAAVKKQKEVDKFKGEKKKFWQLKDEWTDT
ncbi:MAG: hypothetical protein ABII94_02160, partial [Patescibacteria group bacterium]